MQRETKGADIYLELPKSKRKQKKAEKLKIKWDAKEGYGGDYIISYGDIYPLSLSLYGLSQVYAIEHDLWEPAVKMTAEKDKGELWKYTVYYGRMIDPVKLAQYTEGCDHNIGTSEERDAYIRQARGYYDNDLVDKPREVLSDDGIRDLFDNASWFFYKDSRDDAVEIDEDDNNIKIGYRNIPLDSLGELLGTSYPEHYSDDQYRKAMYSSRWNKYYCERKTNPQLAPEFND